MAELDRPGLLYSCATSLACCTTCSGACLGSTLCILETFVSHLAHALHATADTWSPRTDSHETDLPCRRAGMAWYQPPPPCTVPAACTARSMQLSPLAALNEQWWHSQQMRYTLHRHHFKRRTSASGSPVQE